MLKVVKDDLPAAQQARLAAKQKMIDELPDYAARVKHAGELWDRKGEFAEIRTALAAQCSGLQRCQYCEDSAADEIEHVWPKTFYPEKAFLWRNYLYSCGQCNGTFKRAQWAVIGADGQWHVLGRKKGEIPMPPPDGSPAFIDPHIDDPLEFMALDFETGRFEPIAEEGTEAYQRAEYTIAVLGLNERDFLTRARRNAYRDYLRDVEDYLVAKKDGDEEAWCHLQRAIERNHATVWAEIKRMAMAGRAHQSIFAIAPELGRVG
jgi:uncharacterized protein (TIGR02646 family)